MDYSSGIVGAVAAAIGVPLVLTLLRNIKSLKHTPRGNKELDQLRKEYGRWEARAYCLSITFIAIITFSLWSILTLVADLHESRLDDGVFLIYEPSIALVISSFFLAITMSDIPIRYLYSRVMGPERYAEYIEYGNRKHGINSDKVLRYMAYFIVPVSVLFSLMSLDSYMKVTSSEVLVNNFFSTGVSRYSFSDIEYLRLVKSFEAPNGSIVREHYAIIRFNDGNEFNFHKTLHDSDIHEQFRIIDYLSSRSGVEILVDDPYPR